MATLMLINLAGLALLACGSADPLNRADGLISYPEINHLSDVGQQQYPGPSPVDSVPYVTPARIRIKLTRIVKNLDEDNLQAPEVSYFGVLGVGTPGKMFNVVFDTGSNEIWLPYYNWFPLANNLHYSLGYDCKDSSTCVKRNKEFINEYRGTRLEGAVYEDMFTVYEGLTKEDAPLLPSAQISFGQNFLAISDASNEQFRYKPYDGVIGLAPVAHSTSGTRNLLLSLQAHSAALHQAHNASDYVRYGPGPLPAPVAPSYNSPINRYPPPGPHSYDDYYHYRQQQQRQTGLTNPHLDLIFAFWFNPNMNARDGGELMLGDVDESRFSGELIFHKINSWFDWQLRLAKVHLGNLVVSCPDGCNAILDTGANSLIGPREDVERIYQELQAHRDRNADLWLIDCNRVDSYPVIVFNIDGYPYMIYPSHYVKVFRFRDRLVCHLAIKPRDSNDWILGTTFIGAYYTVFNFSQRQVGFATPRD